MVFPKKLENPKLINRIFQFKFSYYTIVKTYIYKQIKLK